MLIKDLPIKLQQLVHKRQMEQGNDGKFDGLLQKEALNKNFTWKNTQEGHNYWKNIDNGIIPKEYLTKTNYYFY